MYHYDPQTALEELSEDAMLPHPVHVRDMIVRSAHARPGYRIEPEIPGLPARLWRRAGHGPAYSGAIGTRGAEVAQASPKVADMM